LVLNVFNLKPIYILKKLFYKLAIVLFFCSGNAQTKIITSKAEAIRKNKYSGVTQKTTNTEILENQKNTIVENDSIVPKIIATKIVLEDENKTNEFVLEEKKDELEYTENPDYNNYFADQLVNNIRDNLGSRYVTGGMSKSGFDCSGLIYATFDKFGVSLPRTANEQSRFGLRIKPAEAKKGDLIFFKTNGRSVINHVGMVIDTDSEGLTFIHSSTNHGVIISDTKEGYYKKVMAQVNRILEEKQ
jgi:murein DD-endopeptidase / murein LD-carboxypeptidase